MATLRQCTRIRISIRAAMGSPQCIPKATSIPSSSHMATTDKVLRRRSSRRRSSRLLGDILHKTADSTIPKVTRSITISKLATNHPRCLDTRQVTGKIDASSTTMCKQYSNHFYANIWMALYIYIHVYITPQTQSIMLMGKARPCSLTPQRKSSHKDIEFGSP